MGRYFLKKLKLRCVLECFFGFESLFLFVKKILSLIVDLEGLFMIVFFVLFVGGMF